MPSRIAGGRYNSHSRHQMGTDKNIKLADDVLALLKQRAEAEGVSVDEAATQAVRIGLEEVRWQRLVSVGRKYGRNPVTLKMTSRA